MIVNALTTQSGKLFREIRDHLGDRFDMSYMTNLRTTMTLRKSAKDRDHREEKRLRDPKKK